MNRFTASKFNILLLFRRRKIKCSPTESSWYVFLMCVCPFKNQADLWGIVSQLSGSSISANWIARFKNGDTFLYPFGSQCCLSCLSWYQSILLPLGFQWRIVCLNLPFPGGDICKRNSCAVTDPKTGFTRTTHAHSTTLFDCSFIFGLPF